MKTFAPSRLALAWTLLTAYTTQARDLDPLRVGSWPGYLRGTASAVVVAGDYAYLAAGSLQVIDVSNPTGIGSPQVFVDEVTSSVSVQFYRAMSPSVLSSPMDSWPCSQPGLASKAHTRRSPPSVRR